METIVYFIRHAEAFAVSKYNVLESEQVENEKRCLSVKGERQAREILELEELCSLDGVYSSHYVRAIGTAKYIAEACGVDIVCDERLGERIVGQRGSMEWRDFEKMQLKDFDFKVDLGESLNQVNRRMSAFLKEVLVECEGQRIAIVGHGTAMVALFSNWCDKGYNFDGKLILDYKDNNIYDGDIKPMQIYKLRFDNLRLVSIERL